MKEYSSPLRCRSITFSPLYALTSRLNALKLTTAFYYLPFGRCINKPENGRQNGLHAGELKTFIQLSLALNEFAKEAKTVSPKKSESENKKFLMRTWLIRLGMVGAEFATAREILMRNLDGDCAFRHGRP